MCEAIFELFGTSSEEIAAKATKEAEIKIHNLTLENASLADEFTSLADEFISLADEFISLADEFISLADEKSHLNTLLANKNDPAPHK